MKTFHWSALWFEVMRLPFNTRLDTQLCFCVNDWRKAIGIQLIVYYERYAKSEDDVTGPGFASVEGGRNL